MTTKTEKAKDQFKLDIQNIYGLKPDRFGHYKFICAFTGRTYRIKIQAVAWRLEVSSPDKRWLRVAGDYFIKGLGLYSKRLNGCQPA